MIGWRLERQSELFAALSARGLAPVRDPEAEGEMQSFFLNDGNAPFTTRRVTGILLAILTMVVLLETLSRRWDRLATNSIFTLIMGVPFLGVARSVRRLDLSDEAVSLRSISPQGLRALLHLDANVKNETLWTLAWGSLRSVRVSPNEGRVGDLWLVLEADHAQYQARYRSAHGTIDDPDELGRLFAARGFPIETPPV
ncbi:hypothetical protein EON77_18035 [bacterium]|nr:MAG: hypothetical protein EON77_18035 [bacterium]